MQIYCFHLMPWAHLPEDFSQSHKSAWVVCPNTLYDPELGHPLYNRYLDELELADQLGFDGVCVNEHHQTAYGGMPSPNIIAACLARRTQRAKLVILGNVLPLYDHPQRVAEEIAMLDVITKGRVVSGMVVGTGMEYFSYKINPTYARERFHEAHDLIIKAWTTDGPFSWDGTHYRFRYVNIWPRPYQKPHPPIWIPGSGSSETMEWVARQKYTYMVLPTLAPFELRRQAAEYFSECCNKAGYTVRHAQIGWGIGIYVADTDEQARREYEPHYWYYARNLLRTTPEYSLPPGHTSMKSVLGMMQRRLAITAVQSLDLGRSGQGGLCDRRQPGNRAPKARRLRQESRLWLVDRELLRGQCAARIYREEHAAVRREGHAEIKGYQRGHGARRSVSGGVNHFWGQG